MNVTFDLENCHKCQHSHYIGGYGSDQYKNVCKHPNANRPKDVKSKFQSSHAQNFIEDLSIIPNWCPLKSGYKYQ